MEVFLSPLLIEIFNRSTGLMSRFLAIFLILSINLISTLIYIPPAWAFNSVKFYDGDNITIIHGGIKAQVHLACIDAPELKQARGQAARKALKKLVNDQSFELNILGRDRIGRFVAEIMSDRGNINRILVEQGYAQFYNPSGKGCDGYIKAERKAQDLHLGIWDKGTNIQSPQEFRRASY